MTKSKHGFIYEWTLFNFIGWILGLIWLSISAIFILDSVIFSLDPDIVYDYHLDSILMGVICWFPFGALLGIMQWLKLKQFKIQVKNWIFFTALGWSILFTGYSLASDYIVRLSGPPFWLAFIYLSTALGIGGAILGGLQARILGKALSRPSYWILANIFGLLALGIMVFGIAGLAFSVKSFFLKLFYLYDLYFLVDARDLLLGGFILLVLPFLSIITITRPMGIILQKYVIQESNPENTKSY